MVNATNSANLLLSMNNSVIVAVVVLHSELTGFADGRKLVERCTDKNAVLVAIVAHLLDGAAAFLLNIA